jgi:hypothetical protein
MEVFSSEEITYSPTPSGFPSQRPSYRSRIRVALAAKSGSRGKIQDLYCQGLIASSASHRRTVDAEIPTAMPCVTASRANSGHDHRDNGAPLAAGS